jgi:cation diffusion facilitator family transporter
VDLADIVTNLLVAMVTGSAVIFAEMAQGIADAAGSLLLLVGERRSRLPGDARYPAGHTREVFFWALLSALVMLVVGSGLSFWRGFTQLAERAPLEEPWLALGVLVLSVSTNGYAVSQSVRRLKAEGRPLREAFREESQPLVKTAFLQDSLGTASAVTGLVSLLLYAGFGAIPFFDAAGAIAIAVLMVGFGVVLVTQMHHFITGRPVPAAMRTAIRKAALALSEVERVNALTVTFTGSHTIVVDIDLDLRDDLTTAEIERVLDRLLEVIRDVEPRVARLRVDLNSPIVLESDGDGVARA